MNECYRMLSVVSHATSTVACIAKLLKRCGTNTKQTKDKKKHKNKTKTKQTNKQTKQKNADDFHTNCDANLTNIYFKSVRNLVRLLANTELT